LEEACVGEGGKSGGTSLDRSLHALMEARFGAAFLSLPPQKTGASSTFMKDFEKIKRNFEGEEKAKKDAEIPLKMKMLNPADKAIHEIYDFDEDMVKLT
jgi:hypothetical protein